LKSASAILETEPVIPNPEDDWRFTDLILAKSSFQKEDKLLTLESLNNC
jgi:hypothetical protein